MRNLLTAALAIVALAACGGNSVGSSGLFDYTPKPPGDFAFGHSPSPAAQAGIGEQPAAQQSSAPKQAPPPPVASNFNIGIFADTSSTPGFYPPAANIYQGTIVVFTNKDSQPRSVVSDSGDPASFSSPMIPPGGTWQYKTSALGTFNYHDGTRPYAIAYFKVVAR